MAVKIKNVAEGFFDATGFHPVRAAYDYAPHRLSTKPAKGAKTAKQKAASVARKEKAKKAEAKRLKEKGPWKRSDYSARQGYGRVSAKTAAKRAAKKTTKRAAPKKAVKKAAKKSVAKKRNPIPSKFTPAKVRTLPGGDVQILLLK
jgi:hypothetical protein